MDVQFMTSIAPIVRDPETSRSFYANALGLGFEGREGDYLFTQELEGTKHFGLGPSPRQRLPASELPNGRLRSPHLRPASSSRSLTSLLRPLSSAPRTITLFTRPALSRGARSLLAC